MDLDKNTQKPYAFVCFEKDECADLALNSLQGRNILNPSGFHQNLKYDKFSKFLIENR